MRTEISNGAHHNSHHWPVAQRGAARGALAERGRARGLEKKSRQITREAVITATRSWIGTPYIHQMSAKGAGCDCLGLVRGVFADLYGVQPETPPPYTADWNERHAQDEPLLSAARRHLVGSAVKKPLPGQVLIFRMQKGGPAKHCGIVCDHDKFIHAYAGRAVIESWLNEFWHQRLAGIFDFPGVT